MITGSDAVGTELVDQAVVTHRAERCRPLMPPGAPSGAIAGALQAPGPCRAGQQGDWGQPQTYQALLGVHPTGWWAMGT